MPYHRPSSIVHRPGLLAVAVALGLSLAAVQVVTFVEFLLSSHALSARAGGPAPFDLGQTALRLAALFYSNFTGTPLEGNYWARPPLNFNEQTGYIGTLAAVLAAMGAIYWWRRDRVVPFFAVAGLLSVLFAVQAPGFNLIKALPIFNVGHGVRWVIVYSFCGATLAAYGIDALLDIKPRTRRFRSAALWLASAALATFGIAFLFYVGIKDYGWDLSWQTLISHENMARLFHPTHRTMYWPAFFVALGAVVALAWWRGWLRARAGTTLLVLLLYADLWVFGSRYNPVTPAQEIFPATQTTRFLAENLGHDRFVGLIGAMRPNAAMLFGFRDLRGYEDLIDEPFAQLYAPVFNALDVSGKDSLYLTRDEHRLLSMAGVRYVLTVRKPRVDGDPAPYLFMFQEGRLATYENLQALPRAYVAFNATTAPNAWRTPDFDPRRTVVLEAGVQPLEGANLDLEAATVVWLKDDPDEVALQATLPQPGYLILSDNYAPGWEATLDGQPAPILRANTVYRAVAVPAGPHTVTFQYRPLTFYIAAAISALAALVLLAIAVLHFVKRKT